MRISIRTIASGIPAARMISFVLEIFAEGLNLERKPCRAIVTSIYI